MDGRGFLDAARVLQAHPNESCWRSAVSRAYYALFHEASVALERWGSGPTAKRDRHAFVRLRFSFATDPDLKTIGDALDELARHRNEADYALGRAGPFMTSAGARQAIHLAESTIDLLDQIEADPVRRTRAIASLPMIP